MSMILLLLVLFPMAVSPMMGVAFRKTRRMGSALLLIAAGLVTLLALLLPEGTQLALPGILGMGLTLGYAGFQKVFAVLTGVIWLAASLLLRDLMRDDRRRGQFSTFFLVTLGATEGVFLAGDVFTMFVFFEMMSFASYPLVKHNGDERARRAGQTYLAVGVTCGLASLMGIFLLYSLTGTLALGSLAGAVAAHAGEAQLYGTGALIAVGFAAKAGMVPLHIWLPESYCSAPAPGTAVLSCVLSKTGVLGVLLVAVKLFGGDWEFGMVLLGLGALTMVVGASLALLSADFKRTLACSSMSQIGFMLTGAATAALLGGENAAAVSGTVLHMINHSFIKLTLFAIAGVILREAGTTALNEIRGFGRKKPLLMIGFLLAGLSVAGVPGFGGYISKTLLHDAILESISVAPGWALGLDRIIEWVFIISGGLTLAYMTKLFVCVFVERGAGETAATGKKAYPATNVMLLASGVCLLAFGLLPGHTLDRIAGMAMGFFTNAQMEAPAYFGAESILGALKSIGIGIGVYLLIVRTVLMKKGADGRREYRRVSAGNISLENRVYRPLATKILPAIGTGVARVFDGFLEGILLLFQRTIFKQTDPRKAPKEDSYFSNYSDEPYIRKGFTDTLAFSLLMFGIGVVVTLLYILIKNV